MKFKQPVLHISLFDTRNIGAISLHDFGNMNEVNFLSNYTLCINISPMSG